MLPVPPSQLITCHSCFIINEGNHLKLSFPGPNREIDRHRGWWMGSFLTETRQRECTWKHGTESNINSEGKQDRLAACWQQQQRWMNEMWSKAVCKAQLVVHFVLTKCSFNSGYVLVFTLALSTPKYHYFVWTERVSVQILEFHQYHQYRSKKLRLCIVLKTVVWFHEKDYNF